MEREFFYKRLEGEKKSALRYPLIIAASALLGFTVLFGKTAPFAAALVGSLYGGGCAAACLGGAVGILLRGDMAAAVPSVIALVSVALVRIFLGKSDSLPVRAASAGLSAAAVTATSLISAAQPTDIIYAAVFGIIAGTACFSLSAVYRLFRAEGEAAVIKSSGAAAVGIAAAFAVAALSSVETGIFNWGVVLSGIFTAAAAGKFRFTGGACAGIVCAFGLALAGTELIPAGLILCVGGLACGIIARYGKIPQAAAFVFASAIAAAALGLTTETLAFIADALVASVAFLALPVDAFTKKLRPRKPRTTGSEPAEVFANRLELVGSTMGELKYALEKTAETLDKEVNRDITWVYNSACDKVCKSCRFSMKCWGEEYDGSARQMNTLLSLMKSGKNVGGGDFSEPLAGRCSRKEQLAGELNSRYGEFVAAAQSNRKIAEMRAVLTNQLDATARLFGELSEEFRGSSGFDTAAALKAERVLERCGAENPRAAVSEAGGNMTVEAYAEGELGVSPAELGDLLSEALRREFDLPDVTKFRKNFRVTAFERASYMVKTARCQYSRRAGQSCGDFADTYIDGKGCSYTVLSDGMGSGGRARIDSAFACGMLVKMLEAGIKVETAAEMLNSSLLVKSADESFATLDILKIDLYTGKTTLYKAGGSDSFVKTGSKVVRLEGKGFPVGISFTTGICDKSFTISENDIVILTSDGAEIQEKWLEQTLGKDSSADLDELVKTIAATAKFNCEKGREDDISVVAVQLVK